MTLVRRIDEGTTFAWDLVVTCWIMARFMLWAVRQDVGNWLLRRLGKHERAARREAEADTAMREFFLPDDY